MKDKISFENSVREKSKKLIAQRNRQRKATVYTLSSLCVCFVLIFGLFLSGDFFPMKAFDVAAPEAANGADFNYSSANGAGDYDSTKESSNDEGVAAAITSKAETQTALATSIATPSDAESPADRPPVSSTVAVIQPSSPAEAEKIIREYTEAAMVYTSLIATHTVSKDDISELADAVFAYDEPKTDSSEEFSVKIVFATTYGRVTYYVKEEDVEGIVPTGDLSGDSGTNTQAPVTSAAAMPPEAEVRAPVRAPRSPFWATASLVPLAMR